MRAATIQPGPSLPGEPSEGPPMPTGIANLEDFWPHSDLTRKTRRQHRLR